MISKTEIRVVIFDVSLMLAMLWMILFIPDKLTYTQPVTRIERCRIDSVVIKPAYIGGFPCNRWCIYTKYGSSISDKIEYKVGDSIDVKIVNLNPKK